MFNWLNRHTINKFRRQQTARIDVVHFYTDNEHKHKVNPPDQKFSCFFRSISIFGRSNVKPLSHPKATLQGHFRYSDHEFDLSFIDSFHSLESRNLKSGQGVSIMGLKFESEGSEICTIRIFSTSFFSDVIKGVCWRNWIAHLTTEDVHLCTVCCHQEVPGSSPG